MDRRRVIAITAGAVAAQMAGVRGAASETKTVEISPPRERGVVMPVDFTGLSYESGQLYNAEYFTPRNTALINAFRGLSAHGVLRLGGHLSNITPWEGVGQDDAKQQAGVRHGIEDYWEWPLVDPSIQANKRGMITRRALENLRGFLDAVNWRLMYTLNFACGSAARAADEAAAVSHIMGDRLLALLVGNEVDGYGEDKFFRAPGYGFDQYFAEYKTWVAAVRAKVPHAPFAGPDTEGHIDTWVRPFAERTRGDVALVTSHFYAMGPASDPAMTAERLLARVNPRLEQEIAGAHTAVAAAGGTPYRMDEGNSCFGGGRPGVSDAYASALWIADYMLYVACAGFAGANLHGGGMGFYTPIETSAKTVAAPRPMYYGMQLAQRFAQFSVAPCTFHTDANVTAYLGTKGAERRLAIINKGSLPVRVTLSRALFPAPIQRRWLLSGPALDAKTGVRFAEDASAKPAMTLEVSAYSAVLLEA